MNRYFRFVLTSGVLFLSIFVILTTGATQVDARMGGGRSFGYRGSRGFSPRTYSAPAARPVYPTSPSAPIQGQRPMVDPYGYRTQPSGGGFMRSMAGGLAGGFLGAMLFRSLGYAQPMGMAGGMGGGGGIGLLEILLIGGVLFLLFRMLIGRFAASATAGGASASSSPWMQDSREKLYSVPRGPYAADLDPNPEDEAQAILGRYDTSFQIDTFKADRTRDFFSLQGAWSKGNIEPVGSLLTPQMRTELETQLSELKGRGVLNKLENTALRNVRLLEAWQELGREYATVQFSATLVDYVVDIKNDQVIEGDRDRPIDFQEEWTFSREIGSHVWALSAISQK